MTTATRPRPAAATRYRQHAATPGWGRLRIRDEDLDPDIYDVTAMERAFNGDPTPLNEAEQYETARQLHALYDDGHEIAGTLGGKRISGQGEIARRVGVSARTILRWNKNAWPDRAANPDGTLRTSTTHTLEERWATHTQPGADGHRIWTGPINNRGLPTFAYKHDNYQGNRVAFAIHNGRAPLDFARPGCGVELCIEPSHLVEIRHDFTRRAR